LIDWLIEYSERLTAIIFANLMPGYLHNLCYHIEKI